MKTASYWKKLDGGKVQCELCPNYCIIADDKSGSCGIRRNRNGALYAESYGLVSSSHVDPIEKKPLYHFRPATDIFSIGGWGCNLHCSFCQNWSISQQFISEGDRYSPEQIVSAAERAGTGAIAYTYNEPLIAMEYVLACCRAARKKGILNVAVTNGYISQEAGDEAIELIDAFNVDIKSMDEGFYRRNCGGKLSPVLDFCAAARAAGRHIEITNLIIPGENESDSLIATLTDWIADNLGADVPLHFSAYSPQYKMKNEPTDISMLARAHEIARARLRYVYIGNVISAEGQDTSCPSCGNCVISRSGYSTRLIGIEDGRCGFCGQRLKGFRW